MSSAAHTNSKAEAGRPPDGQPPLVLDTAFGCRRHSLDNQFVYVVLSPQTRGLSIGINVNPDKRCNFDCVYCEVNRSAPKEPTEFDLDLMVVELIRTLDLVRSKEIRRYGNFGILPPELLQLRSVTLSGDGEPTLRPDFIAIIQAIAHVRVSSKEFFPLILVTNGSGLHLESVQEGLGYFMRDDEIWAKMEAGTEDYMRKISRSDITLQEIMPRILSVAKKRAITIQSLFPSSPEGAPPTSEINEYLLRLKELVSAGAKISLVQISTASGPTALSGYSALPLKTLSHIAYRVKMETGLRAEIF